jgi:hypothetical protein
MQRRSLKKKKRECLTGSLNRLVHLSLVWIVLLLVLKVLNIRMRIYLAIPGASWSFLPWSLLHIFPLINLFSGHLSVGFSRLWFPLHVVTTPLCNNSLMQVLPLGSLLTGKGLVAILDFRSCGRLKFLFRDCWGYYISTRWHLSAEAASYVTNNIQISLPLN